MATRITKEQIETYMSKILDAINDGIHEYQKDVFNMCDEDLYEHVLDDEYNPEDFASTVLAGRGIEIGKALRAILKNDHEARYRVRYIDYEEGYWTLFLQLTEHRINGIEGDKSVERVQVIFPNGKKLELCPQE